MSMLEAHLQTARKMAPEAEGSFSLSLKSWAARGKSALSRGSTTGNLCFMMRSQMLPPARALVLLAMRSVDLQHVYAALGSW